MTAETFSGSGVQGGSGKITLSEQTSVCTLAGIAVTGGTAQGEGIRFVLVIDVTDGEATWKLD